MAATATAVNRGRQGRDRCPLAGHRSRRPTGSPAVPARSRRRGVTPLTPMRQDTAKSMSKLADQMKETGPDITAHQHVRDAARVLRSGNEEAAGRHLRAAMFALTPQSLHRQGIHNDDGHTAARTAMHGVHRHLLLVKDIQDVAAKNQRLLARDSYGDLEWPTLPQSPERDGPDAGYGPGALAQKPTARQPGGDRAMNAPARTSAGRPDPNVANPVGSQRRGPGLPSVASHNAALLKKGVTPPTKAHPALTREPPAVKAPAKAQAPAKAVARAPQAAAAPAGQPRTCRCHRR